jgi:hypothetical protein
MKDEIKKQIESMKDEIKKQIESMSYEEMLRKNRFGLDGDPLFKRDAGRYFQKVMKAKEEDLLTGERVAISKRIGWEDC